MIEKQPSACHNTCLCEYPWEDWWLLRYNSLIYSTVIINKDELFSVRTLFDSWFSPFPPWLRALRVLHHDYPWWPVHTFLPQLLIFCRCVHIFFELAWPCCTWESLWCHLPSARTVRRNPLFPCLVLLFLTLIIKCCGQTCACSWVITGL